MQNRTCDQSLATKHTINTRLQEISATLEFKKQTPMSFIEF